MFSRRAVGLVALSICAARPAMAQRADSTRHDPLFTRRDAVAAGIATVATVAITRLDTKIARWWRDSSFQSNKGLSDFVNQATKVNETTLTLGALATYGIARLVHAPRVQEIAIHTAEAVFAASVTSQLIRGPLGRSRPDVTNYQDPYDFKPFKGFSNFDYRAFPSIHSSSGFAAATVIVAELAKHNPSANWYVAPIAAAVAVVPGATRLYLGQHWASDIVAGAFIGTLAGLKVVSYSHNNPDNALDRFFLGKTAGAQINQSSGRWSFSYGWTF